MKVIVLSTLIVLSVAQDEVLLSTMSVLIVRKLAVYCAYTIDYIFSLSLKLFIASNVQ